MSHIRCGGCHELKPYERTKRTSTDPAKHGVRKQRWVICFECIEDVNTFLKSGRAIRIHKHMDGTYSVMPAETLVENPK